MIRVLLVDDTEEIRALLRTALELEPDIDVVGEASDGGDAVACAEALQPDVVVLDWQMPVMDGPSAVPELRRAAPLARIVMFSNRYGPAAEQTALEAGAHYFLEKQSNLEDLVSAMREVLRSGPA